MDELMSDHDFEVRMIRAHDESKQDLSLGGVSSARYLRSDGSNLENVPGRLYKANPVLRQYSVNQQYNMNGPSLKSS